jgi:uncharacterized protein (DUF433 family)
MSTVEFSLTEAAAIGELPPEVIRTALEKARMPLSRKHRVGKAVRHGFSIDDVFLLKLLAEFPFPLPKNDKVALKTLLTRGARRAGPWRTEGPDLVFSSGDMTIVVECKALRDRLRENAAAFQWGRNHTVSALDILNGTPVFRGTRIPVDHIGELLRKGISNQEILEDFPQLCPSDLAYAKLHVRLGARPGRPRKRLQLRRKREAA